MVCWLASELVGISWSSKIQHKKSIVIFMHRIYSFSKKQKKKQKTKKKTECRIIFRIERGLRLKCNRVLGGNSIHWSLV